MTAEFDEEVVFENSPLYHYLQDLGQTDFEICAAVPQETEQCPAEEGQRMHSALTTPTLHFLSSLVDTFKNWSLFSLERKKDETLHKLDVGFRLDSLCTILQQEVLLQEDVELIELLDPGILSAGQAEHPETRRHLPTLRSLATPNIWEVSVILAFACVLWALQTWDISSWVMWGPGLVAFAAFVFLEVAKKWRMARLQLSLRKYCTQVEETVADSRAFTNLVRKALRLIQETEVISRGFTLVSAACPFDKAGQHPSQHLIGLRKAVYRAVRANFRASRLATLYMLKHYPLNSEIDNVTNYICVVPLKDLRLGLSKVQVSEEEAHNLTDGFSLPALKVLFQLWIGQSSEFYRRLALLLSPENEAPSPSLTLENLPHCIWSYVAMDIPHTQATCLTELKRSYEFYRYFETQHQSDAERTKKSRQKMGELNNLHCAVRSLQLHLKALLSEVIILEDDVEKLSGTKDAEEPAMEAYLVLEQKLKVIQPHMQASNSCWEEASYQLEKMVRRRPEKKDDSPVLCENSHCGPTPNLTAPLHIENKDPIPEEQEFEAIVEETDLNDEFRRDDFYCLSPEDKERQQREREESKRVLQELKSVLGLKASEAERLKWKQLLFSDHAAMTPLSPVESSTEPTVNGVLHTSSDSGTQDPDTSIEAYNKKIKLTDKEKLRTEYVSEETVAKWSAGACIQANTSPEKEKTCYQCEGNESSQVGAAETESPEPTHRETVQSSIKERLARLHLSTDFSFSSRLAAQVAARSIAFTFMDEQQTFGDDEEEETDGNDGVLQENGNLVEENKNEQSSQNENV